MIGQSFWLRTTAAHHEPIRTTTILPEAFFDFGFAQEIVWMLGVTSVVGEPTSWSLDVKFQYRMDHTYGWHERYPVWFDVPALNLTSDLVEGEGFTAFTATGYQKRTMLHHPRGVRMVATPSFTGGTDPGLHVAATFTTRG